MRILDVKRRFRRWTMLGNGSYRVFRGATASVIDSSVRKGLEISTQILCELFAVLVQHNVSDTA